MKLGFIIFFTCFSVGLYAQSKLIVSYIHPLLNFQLSKEINVSNNAPFYVSKIIERSPIGFSACYNKQVRFSTEWVISDIYYTHTFYFPQEYNLNQVLNSHSKIFEDRIKTYRFSGSYKIYRDRKYSTWLGISLIFYPNIFLKSERFYVSDVPTNDDFIDEVFYTESLTIKKSGSKRILSPSIFVKHIVSFPRREFIFTSGVQFFIRQKHNLSYTYNTPTTTSTLKREEMITSALLYFNFSMSRKLKFKHGDGRLERLLGINKRVE